MVILDGKKLASVRIEAFKDRVSAVTGKLGRKPNLSVVLVGDDPASKVYVGHKEKQCVAAGIESTIIRLSGDISESDLASQIETLNKSDVVDGILVQLPLPSHLKDFDPSENILATKDVDGLTAQNMGLMIKGRAYAEPCTPKGIIALLKHYEVEMSGKKVAVLGRSQIVGWPMAWMLTRENATVTVCHSRTKDLDKILKESDIVVAAVGKPQFLNKDSFKEGAVVVDVGIHRLDTGKLAGDVDPVGFEEKNISYSPVPGGVGPMTVNQLLENLIELVTLKI
ncbi:MAG: bifunctional 5,10-methylenetetrahydrofolate dehydrogenase/5,10-methenyltetrahydrofolate cyclohydrolase [Bdellovibrionales bacterium]